LISRNSRTWSSSRISRRAERSSPCQRRMQSIYHSTCFPPVDEKRQRKWKKMRSALRTIAKRAQRNPAKEETEVNS